MLYTRSDYEYFLSSELAALIKEYEQLVHTKALVLKARGDVFVGKFMKIQDNGMVIFKVRNSDNLPRKNSYWTACELIGEMSSFKNWGDRSWVALRRDYQKKYSEAYCAWISRADDPDFCLIGVKNVSVEFAELLKAEEPIIAFGPNDPPLQYLLNLIDVVKEHGYEGADAILDFAQNESVWSPKLIGSSVDFPSLLESVMSSNDCVIVQGPPGTGKTSRLAKLSAKLLSEGRSVLVTALTNQALMELAKKDDLKEYVSAGKVSKTSLTVDESKELPRLIPIKDNKCNSTPGQLSLASFYLSSGWAKEAIDTPFDYVLMDEASQAFLPMIAATRRLGKKVLWIGDQKQLAPIVIIKEDVINDRGWTGIINGFNSICLNFHYPSFMLSDTFRLTERAAASTGVFYDNQLRSVSETQIIPTSIKSLNKAGGPVMLEMDLKVGDKAPGNAISAIYNLTQELIAENPNYEIAILSKFRETVRQVQKAFVLASKSSIIPEKVKIETVDRVQGLTVDFCIFLIPNASMRYSLSNELFNVATSRARYNTILVADKLLLRERMSEEVRKYILKSQEDRFATLASPTPQRISVGDIGVTVVGKVDVSKFERKHRELSPNKGSIYIIDTNVFVNCPDIISRIGKDSKVIVPSKVLEELDKLKLKAGVDKTALNRAAKNIGEAFARQFSRMEDADTSLLPVGFDKCNPDCMILSVAIKHKADSPILLTSDNLLQARASALGITTISLKDFLRK